MGPLSFTLQSKRKKSQATDKKVGSSAYEETFFWIQKFNRNTGLNLDPTPQFHIVSHLIYNVQCVVKVTWRWHRGSHDSAPSVAKAKSFNWWNTMLNVVSHYLNALWCGFYVLKNPHMLLLHTKYLHADNTNVARDSIPKKFTVIVPN